MKKPKLLVIAGPNGSGKTSVTAKILKHTWIEDCEYINPDRIKIVHHIQNCIYTKLYICNFVYMQFCIGWTISNI
jgi:predicted ABC-type ATPase